MLKESEFLPQVAVGFRDFAGTGIFASEYIVGSKFIKDLSINVPVLYGMLSILLALILGVGAAILRRFFSNLRKKQSAKSK